MELLQRALALVGTPYVEKALDPAVGGLNCVGFVHFFRTEVGLVYPTTALELAREGRPYHFGLVTADGIMLHASSKRGVELHRIPLSKRHEFRRLDA